MSKFTYYLEVPTYEALGVHYYFHFITFNCANEIIPYLSFEHCAHALISFISWLFKTPRRRTCLASFL